MHKALHPRYGIGRLYVSRKKEKRKLMFMHKTYIPGSMLTDFTCQEKKEVEDLPALKTSLTHWSNGSKT